MNTNRLNFIASIALTLLASAAFAQGDFAKVRITTEKLSATTYMMTGAGGNLGLSIGEDAVFLIDDQYAPLTPRIKEAIARLTRKPVKFVLNTHWHGDHTGGNENIGKDGALIVAHENVRKRLSAAGLIEFVGMKTPPSPKAALPVVTFTRDLTFHINGDEVAAFHVPNAHTDGDAIVHFRNSDVIHAGDVFFNKMYPFIDTSSGGTMFGVIAAVDRMLGIAGDNTKIIPGHGSLASKADLQAYRDMLATVAARIQAQIKEGKKLDEVIASNPTAEFDPVWGKSYFTPQKWVEMLYKNLQSK